MRKIFIIFLFFGFSLNAASERNSTDYYFDMASQKSQDVADSFFQALGFFGKGVEKNFAGTKDYFDKAYEQSSKSFDSWYKSMQGAFSDENLTLVKAYIYKDGNSTKEFSQKEFNEFLATFDKTFNGTNYLKSQTSEGNTTAAFELANLYSMSKNSNDVIQAKNYYEIATKSSNNEIKAAALYSLGEIYFYGKGVIINYKKALEFYEQSAKLGYPKAQGKLGLMYFNGVEVKKDIEKAKELLSDSCEGGFIKACEFYNENFIKKYSDKLQF